MNDFDFLTGTWDIVNRWRTSFLDPGSEWEEFPGVSHASRHFDGNANFDEIIFPTKGFSGLTLRLYNPDTGQWSLYWASKRTGRLFPPVTGAFKDGTGEFFGEDTHDDVPVLVRFRWTDITSGSARWEQAFSPDSGETWLDNWYMNATRRPLSALAQVPRPGGGRPRAPRASSSPSPSRSADTSRQEDRVIARIWRGWAPLATADDYQRHYRSEVTEHLRAVSGFRGARLLRQDQGQGPEPLGRAGLPS